MVPTTWRYADEVVSAQAQLDVTAGGVPRPHLITFESGAATLVALGPDEEPRSTARAVVALTELVSAIGAERYVLGAPLAEPDDIDPSDELTAAVIAAPRHHLSVRVWPGRFRRRVRLRGRTYGRADDGSAVWGRPRRVMLRGRAAFQRCLLSAIGDPRRSGEPAELVAVYLTSSGYRIAVAPGWAERYGVDRLVGR